MSEKPQPYRRTARAIWEAKRKQEWKQVKVPSVGSSAGCPRGVEALKWGGRWVVVKYRPTSSGSSNGPDLESPFNCPVGTEVRLIWDENDPDKELFRLLHKGRGAMNPDNWQ